MGSKVFFFGKERKGNLKGFGRLRREWGFFMEIWDVVEFWIVFCELGLEFFGFFKVLGFFLKVFLLVCFFFLDFDY